VGQARFNADCGLLCSGRERSLVGGAAVRRCGGAAVRRCGGVGRDGAAVRRGTVRVDDWEQHVVALGVVGWWLCSLTGQSGSSEWC